MASSMSINCHVNGNWFQYEDYSQLLNENKPPRFFGEPVLSQDFLQLLQLVTIWNETTVTTKALSEMQNDRPLLVDISRREFYLVPQPYIHASLWRFASLVSDGRGEALSNQSYIAAVTRGNPAWARRKVSRHEQAEQVKVGPEFLCIRQLKYKELRVEMVTYPLAS